MAQSNFKFTGNPRVAKYQPRGLEYFTFLPKLKAQVRGAAMKKANELSFNTSGLMPEDLNQVQERTGFITDNKNKIVDRLLDGDSVTEAVVRDLVGLHRNKSELDQQINVARENAVALQKYENTMDNYGRQIGNTAFTQKVKEDSRRNWGGTFGQDGGVNQFTPIAAPDYADPVKKAQQMFQIAYQDMTPEQRGTIKPSDFQVIQVPNGDGTFTPRMTYNKPKDLFTNNPALASALDRVNEMFTEPVTAQEGGTGVGSKEYNFLNYMGSDYTSSVMNEINAINGLYSRTQEVASGQTVTGAGGGTTAADKARQGAYRAPNTKFVEDKFALAGREELSSIATPEISTQRGAGADGSPIETTNIDPRDLAKFQKQDKSQADYLFGNVNSIEDLSQFIVNDTDEDIRNWQMNNPNRAYTHKYRTNPLSDAARNIVQEGDLGYTAGSRFREAANSLVDIQKQVGGDFSLTLTEDELKNPTRLSKAKLKLRQEALALHNEGIVENSGRRNSNLYVTEPTWDNQYMDTHGSIKTEDEYKNSHLQHIKKSANEGVVYMYRVDDTTGNMEFLTDNTTTEGRENMEIGSILSDKDHLRPNMMTRGYDFGKDAGLTGVDRVVMNRKMSQGLVYSVKNDDGDRIMYVVQNPVNTVKNQNVKVELVQTPGDDKGITMSLEDAVLSLEQGDSKTITLTVPNKKGEMERVPINIRNTGGMYRVGSYRADGSVIEGNAGGATRQELLSLIENNMNNLTSK